MPSTKFTLLTCRCGWRWIYRGSLYRAQCSKCKMWVKTGIGVKSTKIDEKILNGNILRTMDQMGINNLLKKNALGDCILYVLDDELILALNKASKKMRKKPVALIRKVVHEWLEKEGYLPLMYQTWKREE